MMASGVFVLARTSLSTITYTVLAAIVGIAVQRQWISNAVAVLVAGVAGAILESLGAS